MYSDFSLYTEGSSRDTQKNGPPALLKQNTQPLLKQNAHPVLKKTSSLHSLEDKDIKANLAKLKDNESSKEKSIQQLEDTPKSKEAKTLVMAETAQRVVEESSTSQTDGQSPAQTSKSTNSDTAEASTSKCNGEDKSGDKIQGDTQENKVTAEQGGKPQNGTQGMHVPYTHVMTLHSIMTIYHSFRKK